MQKVARFVGFAALCLVGTALLFFCIHALVNMGDVFDAFNSICYHARGVSEGLVYSVIPLDEQTLKKLEQKISKLEGVEVELTNKIDHNLIGGIKVVIHGKIYDGSIKNKLENMRTDLLKKEGVTYEN